MIERPAELRRLLATLGALLGLTVLLVAFFALVFAFAPQRGSPALIAAAFALAAAGLFMFGWSMHALARNWRSGPPGTNEV